MPTKVIEGKNYHLDEDCGGGGAMKSVKTVALDDLNKWRLVDAKPGQLVQVSPYSVKFHYHLGPWVSEEEEPYEDEGLPAGELMLVTAVTVNGHGEQLCCLTSTTTGKSYSGVWSPCLIPDWVDSPAEFVSLLRDYFYESVERLNAQGASGVDWLVYDFLGIEPAEEGVNGCEVAKAKGEV